ncbi:MAG: hypothetical protein E7362_01450 [Clostridiales bacterium]|nr:hypothetical protein [Clostridiales bacterium]
MLCAFACNQTPPPPDDDGGEEDIPVTEIVLDKELLLMDIGDTAQLVATVLPNDATNKNITWASNESSVATVSTDGLVTAVAEGSAVIYVATEDGGFADICTVIVQPETPDEPTDPVEPEEPTDPVDPEEPTDPVDPDEPTDPVEPEEPT